MPDVLVALLDFNLRQAGHETTRACRRLGDPRGVGEPDRVDTHVKRLGQALGPEGELIETDTGSGGTSFRVRLPRSRPSESRPTA